LDELREDYRQMQVMIFGEVPSFDEVFEALTEAEKAVNYPLQS
jgi:hypothetical protein